MKAQRFIYAYRDKASGQAVYVGSTFNVKRRHYGHCAGKTGCPFDDELAKKGRDAFTLETLEVVDADKTIERENHWMDVLGTFRTPHGFNTLRAVPVAGDGDQTHVIVIRFPNETAAALAEHKKITGVPTEVFIRRAVGAALDREKTRQRAAKLEQRGEVEQAERTAATDAILNPIREHDAARGAHGEQA